MSFKDKNIDLTRVLSAYTTAVFATLVALSGAVLGGDATKFGEVAPILGVGLLLIVCPLKALPNRVALLGIGGLVATGFLGFMPVFWFGEPEWHSMMRQAVPGLSNNVSLQPLVTLTRLCEMLAAIFFAMWAVQWRPVRWVLGLRVLAGAIASVAALALAAYFFSFSMPGWHPSQGFGPFANRNQTGTLMVLGAILSLGLVGHSMRTRRPQALLWATAFCLCVTALLYANSRGSLLLLALGIFCGVLLRQKVSPKGVAVAASLLLLIGSAGLLARGEFFRRVTGFVSEGGGLRAQIYQDTIQLVKTVPLEGIGLGNFDVIFPWFRNASLNGQRIVHPESDWLWLVSEMGVMSLAFVLIASVSCFWPARATGTRGEDMRVAGNIAVVLFLVNSLFDVPGHRFGTVLPLFLVAGICCRSKLYAGNASAIPWLGRFAGIGLIVFGAFVLGSNSTNSNLKGALTDKDWERVDRFAGSALTRAPLNWSLYVSRGYASVHEKKWLQAIADFRSALSLEPKLAIVPYEVGRAWIGISVPMAIAAWQECLRRSREDERSENYRQILDSSSTDRRLLESALRLADGNSTLCLVALRSGYSDPKTLQFLEEEKPRLDSEQLRLVLKAEALQSAAEDNYQKAYELGRKAIRHIAFPTRQERSERQCRMALVENPGDLGAAFDLCLILKSENRWDEAVRILAELCNNQDCPDYVKLLNADFLASLRDWRHAWDVVSELL